MATLWRWRKTSLQMVAEFHRAFGHPIATAPKLANTVLNKLRTDLIEEELSELKGALSEECKTKALDALCDLQYVLDGAFLALGYAGVKEVAMAEVHRSNMTKLWTEKEVVRARQETPGLMVVPARTEGQRRFVVMRLDGKILKSPSYSPADLSRFVA